MNKNMKEICRTCLSARKRAKYANIDEMIGVATVLKLIIEIASVKVLTNDPLPKFVCSVCFEKLRSFKEFRQTIINSDNLLKTQSTGEESLKNNDVQGLDEQNYAFTKENSLQPSLSKYSDDENAPASQSELEQEPLVEQSSGKRIYECRECNKHFKKEDHYKVHMTVHTGEKKYACEFCPKRFARSYGLVYHRRVHTGERPYTCDICSKSFSSPSNFYTHKKIHGGKKNYKCKLCDESFLQSDSLKIHVRKIHTGERPFLCEICSSAFRSNSSLLTHKLDMHGEKECCPLCNKSYSSRVLKEHIRRHKEKEQGIKRYPCDQCGKRFTCSSSRKKHLLIHSGEKPYSCEICDKSFNQRSALKTHTRVHSDFLPFQCEFCTKGFRHKHHLRSHNNNHHKEMLQEDIKE